MKIIAINGSYRKNKTINTLLDKAIEGVLSVDSSIDVEKIHLIDQNINYCKGCMACFFDDPEKPIAKCVINDDMHQLCQKLYDADGYIFGTPIFMGTLTAVMKTFCERFCWMLSRPGKRPIKGCPEPRCNKRKSAVIIMSTSIIPRVFRMFCDDAIKFFKGNLPCTLNAKVIGSVYAGKVGVGQTSPNNYFKKSIKLGKKFAVELK